MKNQNAIIAKLQEQMKNDMQLMQKIVEEERKKTENDMQYMDTKLSLVDDSTVMKKFIA